jgi:fucose permease
VNLSEQPRVQLASQNLPYCTRRGMDTNHNDFQGRAAPVLAVSLTLLVLATVFVFFRMVSRAAIVKKVATDDYFMVVAWIIAFGLTVSVIWGTRYGLGRHAENIPSEWTSTLKKCNYVFSVLYNPALMMSKTSILVFYLTLSKSNHTFRWATIATLVVVNAGGFALTMLNVWQCTPVNAVFRTPIPSTASCTDIVTIYLSSAPLNIITDLAILFLPMPILTSMRLPKKQKIILIVTFSFGIFVTAIDVVRIAYLQSAAETRIANIHSNANEDNNLTAESTDFNWYASLSFMWSVAEVNIGIMCACVPALKPLVSRFLPRMLRDAGDVTEKDSSTSGPRNTYNSEMANAHRVPSLAERPPSPQRANTEPHEDEGPMGMMDFLTTPDMNGSNYPGGARLDRTTTMLTNTTRHTSLGSPTFFDFVNMNKKKSMVQMTSRESVFPFAMVSLLFFIWGFEYGLIDVLNGQFQQVARMTPGQTTSIHSAYFVGYLLGPWLVGRWVLNNWGFKACYSVGLSIYACGTLIFWPSAVLTSYPAYLITNVFVGFGLSILEVAANPFVALCGPPQYAEVRLLLSQAIQAVGTVIAPLIANRAFFTKHYDADIPSLVDTQYAYLGIALFTVLLAVVYHYVPLPEATTAELEDASERMDGANKAKIKNLPVIWIILGLAAFSQFCYVGAQEVNGTVFDNYLAAVVGTDWNVSNYMAVAHTCFAVSRFAAAGLGLFIRPRHLTLLFMSGAVIFQTLAMYLDGRAGLAMILMVFFMEGPLFPLIFAQALRGMGKHTKLASVVVTSAISGGAVFSPISSRLVYHEQKPQFALIVGAVAFGAGLIMPIGVSVFGKVRRVVDPMSWSEAANDDRPSSTSSVASRALSIVMMGKRSSKESGVAEFRERSSNGGTAT